VPPLARSAPPEPMPVRQVTAAPALATAAPSPQPEPARPAASGPAPAAAEPAATRPAPTLASASGFNLARVGATATPSSGAAPAPLPAAAAPPPAATPAPKPAPFPAPAAAPAPAPARASSPARAPRRVADAFADFTLPTGPAAPAPGAVDIRKIAPAKPKPVEPAKPAHPSRIWVQVGTGRDVKALGFTWRGLAKDNPELFRGKEPSVSDWGRTNRLLTGPFTTEAGAEAFLARLRKNEVDAFIWTSPAGQVVDDLPGR